MFFGTELESFKSKKFVDNDDELSPRSKPHAISTKRDGN
jgi:hypothetical protein